MPEQPVAVAPEGTRPVEDDEGRLSALMVLYQGGDPVAFRELFEVLQRPLRGYLISLTRELAKAEDLLQEAFLQLHRSRHTYQPPRPVRPWAFSIARHVFLMDRRANKRRMRLFDDHLEVLPELPILPRALGFADREALYGALCELPEDHREVLLLHHVWGFSFAEIGQTLGMRAGTAKVRSHRGIRRLRRLLGVDGDE